MVPEMAIGGRKELHIQKERWLPMVFLVSYKNRYIRVYFISCVSIFEEKSSITSWLWADTKRSKLDEATESGTTLFLF